MFDTDFITFFLILFFAATLVHRLSFFHKKRVGWFSLTQALYLVVVPGFAYTFLFRYIQSILERPLNQQIIVPDSLLIDIILLTALFSYGGLAIHSTSKMLSTTLIDSLSKAREMNSFFHLALSHNMIYIGGTAAVVSFTLFELNHVSPNNLNSPILAILKGIILGLMVIASMYWYTVSDDPKHPGRWSDFKTSFIAIWLGFITVVYGVKKTNPALKEFDILLPALASFLLLAGLSAILIIRRVKKGQIQLYLRVGKFKKRII